MIKPKGIIIHETNDIVCIAIGFKSASQNSKTGSMIQIYILYKHLNPIEAVKQGLDKKICFNCKHRGVNGIGRTCYVTLMHGPLNVYKAWLRGNYEPLNNDNIKAFEGRMVRFGSYGCPTNIPIKLVRRIVRLAKGHTGYTHEWKRKAHYMPFFMASVDTFEESMEAWAQGWRTFRVNSGDNSPQEQTIKATNGEIGCPASAEMGKKTTCAACSLCSGGMKQAKNIVINAHGTGKKHFAA